MSHARAETFEHGADVGVRGIGRTLDEAFAQAALALTSVVTDPAVVEPRARVGLSCEAPEPEILFLDWLDALIYEMATRRMLFSRFEVRIDGRGLRASAWGEKVDRARHEPAVEVKGATATMLEVARGGDGLWRAQCVVDV